MAGVPFMQGDMKGVTREEVSKLTRAMKDGQFRDHMDEYCREVSDPANRKEYIQYLEQLEAKGEMPQGQQLLRTEPGVCIKTQIRFKNGQTQKLFLNIVHSDRLHDLTMESPEQGGGRQVHLPYSLSPPRPDRDLKDQYCMTADCAVSSRTFFQAAQYPNILKMIVDIAAEGMAQTFLKGYEEVKKDFKVMEKLRCKGGFPMPMSVKAELLKDKGAKGHKPSQAALKGDGVTPSELRQMRADAKAKRASQKAGDEDEDGNSTQPPPAKEAPKAEEQSKAPRIRVPKHRLIHSGSVDLADFMEAKNQPLPATTTVPKTLRLVVELPTVKKSSDVSLEVTSNNVVVEVPDKFYLDLPLSYEVEDTRGTAKFDKTKQELTLELPVVPKPPIFRPEAAALEREGANDDRDGALREGHEESEEELPELQDADPAASAADSGKDWIDQIDSSGLSAAPAEHAAEAAPPRQRLELEPEGSALRIAGAVAAATGAEKGSHDAKLQEEELVEEGDEEELPEFVASADFTGARPGYYFGTGLEGLGYYKDRRQPRRAAAPARSGRAKAAASPPAVAAATAASALVEEVTQPGTLEEKPRPPLPPSLCHFVATSTALGQRLDPSTVDAPTALQAEPVVEFHQNRQNVLIFVDLPRGHEVADLQLAITGHRLTLAYCTRPPGEADAGLDDIEDAMAAATRWQRRRLRRTLCGAADPRQWHAELVDRGEASPPQLGLVLRKVRRGDMWPQVCDEAAAPAASEPWEAIAEPQAPKGGSSSSSSEAAPAAGAAAAAEEAAGAGEAGDAGDGEEAEEGAQDSAELDVAPPVASPAPGPGASAAAAGAAAVAAGAAGGAVAQVTATAAMVQSAAVMGQSVLLRSRLMYQLL